MALSDNLKKIREEHKFTKKEVCEKTGISERAYLTYEYGEREPKISVIQKLATFYGVTTDYLLGQPDAKSPENPIDTFARAERLKELEKIIIKEYLELGNKEREAVLDFIRNCIKKEEERKKLQIEPIETTVEKSHNPNIIQNSRVCPVAVRSKNNTPPHLEILTEEEIEKIRNAERVPEDL